MNRREFISLIGGAAVTWPLAARAQQPAMPVVGFLNSQSPVPFSHMVAGFRRGLSEGDFVEGQNIAIEYRWAEGHYERLPTLANELVRRGPAVLVATGGSLACRGPQTSERIGHRYRQQSPMTVTQSMQPLILRLTLDGNHSPPRHGRSRGPTKGRTVLLCRFALPIPKGATMGK
jgi:hypothetical protein